MESFEEFEEWFQRQGKDVRNLISIRALIREFPLLDAAEIKLAFDQKAKTRFVLAALRCLTAAGSVMVNPSPETQKAARAAAQAADRMVTDAFAGGDTGDDLANPNYEAIHPNAEILRRALRLATDVLSEDGVKKAIRPTAEMQDAMLADSEVEFDKLMATPLWGIAGEPEWLSTDAPHAHRLTASGDQWRFWRDWYQGFLDGKPLDWELQRRVALIPDEDWEKGPEHIAELIEEIRNEFGAPNLDPGHVLEQAKRLAATPKTTYLIASQTASAIEVSIHDFLNTQEINQLPDCLTPLHNLPPLLRSMAQHAQDAERIKVLEAEIENLVSEVARLTKALEEAKSKPLRQRAAETAVLTTVAIATTGFWSSVIATISYMTGVEDIATLLERFSVIGQEPPSIEQLAPQQLPKTTDV